MWPFFQALDLTVNILLLARYVSTLITPTLVHYSLEFLHFLLYSYGKLKCWSVNVKWVQTNKIKGNTKKKENFLGWNFFVFFCLYLESVTISKIMTVYKVQRGYHCLDSCWGVSSIYYPHRFCTIEANFNTGKKQTMSWDCFENRSNSWSPW